MFDYLQRLSALFEEICNSRELSCFLSSINEELLNGYSIYIAGNGGSHATSSHFAIDLETSFEKHKSCNQAIVLSEYIKHYQVSK